MTRIEEPARLAALARSELIDSPPEQAFDRVTELASVLLGAPVTLMSLVGGDRAFFKSAHGVDAREMPLSHVFCRHVVTGDVPFLVADARCDPRVSHEPAVRDYGLIAYCGVPLADAEGHTLGSLCAVDREPRAWTDEDVAVLRELAATIMTELALREADRELARREEALRTSEQRFRRAFDDAPIGIGILSLHGRWQQVNVALCEIVGYAAEELSERTYQQITHPDDLDVDAELLRELAAGDIPRYEAHKRYLHKTGRAVWVKLQVSLVRDDEGTPLHLVAHVEDVSEDLAAREARDAVEERQRVLLSSLPDAMIVLFDREERCTLLQGQLVAELGLDPERVLGAHLSEVVPAERYAVLHGHLACALRGHSASFEYTSAEGRMYQVEVEPYRPAGSENTGAFSVWRDITERVERERENRMLATVVQQSHDAIIAEDGDGRIIHWNAGAQQLYGYTAQEAIGQHVSMLVPSERAGETEQLLGRAQAGEAIPQLETVRRHRDGSRVHVSLSLTPLQDAAGAINGASIIARDIGDRIEREAAQREAEERWRVTVEHLPIGVALVDLDPASAGRMLSVNAAFGALFPEPDPVANGLAIDAILAPDDALALEADLSLLALDPLARTEREVRCMRPDGRVTWLLLGGAAVPAGEDQTPRQAVVHALDIGERKRFEGQLQYLADHDVLTGLFNRRRFEEELDRARARVMRYGGQGAVLLVDLDGFKHVNDLLGHSSGDELVRRIGGTLRETLRETDVVARVGGDEFAVILPEAGPAEAVIVAEKILAGVARNGVQVDGPRRARVTASIGITGFNDTSTADREALMVQADIAMYQAKGAGKNRHALYEPPVDSSDEMPREDWLGRLRRALTDDHFELVAQPIRPISAGDGDRFELLLRLRGDDGELIGPSTFMHNAERFDVIQQIDRWVFAEAARLLRAHAEAGHDISLSVNMSAKTLSDPEIVNDMTRILRRCPIPHDRLIVEVTETAAIVNVDTAAHVARQLRELGCRFALDDFGAGFASFYYLKHLEFDYVKIDGEFIKTLTTSPTDQLVVKALVEVAHGLGVQTIAEFVGCDAAVVLLERLGVDYGQGYHLGRPLPLREILPAGDGRHAQLSGADSGCA